MCHLGHDRWQRKTLFPEQEPFNELIATNLNRLITTNFNELFTTSYFRIQLPVRHSLARRNFQLAELLTVLLNWGLQGQTLIIFLIMETIRELGRNYLLISRDFKNCMVIRAIYFKVFALANR